MTRHYSTRDFFRQMPNADLARYFTSREVLQDFDFTAMKETKVDALFDAWMVLPEAVRVKLEAELRAKGVTSEIIERNLQESTRNDADELQKIIAKKRRKYPDEQKLIQ